MFKKICTLLTVASILASLLSACSGSSSADEDAQKLLAGLINKAKVMVNQPSWVHVTEKVVYDTDKQDRGKLSTGNLIPLVHTVDIWYHINETKRVYEYVWLLSREDGETIEVMVFLNNTLFNLTNNVSDTLNPYSLSLDYQFADEMDSFISRKGHPVVTTAVVNGKTATVFSLDEELASLSTTTDYTQPFVAAGSIASFDSETGLLLKLERTVILADGTKRMFYTDNITVETGMEPTLEVQDYVNGFW